jgi:hypothetical protein
MKVKFFILPWLLLVSSFVLPINGAAQQAPKSMTLTYSIDETLGDLRATLRFSGRLKRSCFARLYSRLSNTLGNNSGLRKVEFLRTKLARRNTRTLRFTARDLPPVRQVREGTGEAVHAKLNIQATLTCGSRVVSSNVMARYLDCGSEDLSAVSISRFMTVLKDKIR